MSDIFVSYANEDRLKAQILVQALEARGWSIFWDRKIPVGRTWHDSIGRELSEARCVVVLWSNASVESEWVREEADDARQRGVLMPVRIDNIQPPIGFRGIQAANLIGLNASEQTPALEGFASDIAMRIGIPDSRLYSATPRPGPPPGPAPPVTSAVETKGSTALPEIATQRSSRPQRWLLYVLGIGSALAPVVYFSIQTSILIYSNPEASILPSIPEMWSLNTVSHIIYGIISINIWIRFHRVSYIFAIWLLFYMIDMLILYLLFEYTPSIHNIWHFIWFATCAIFSVLAFKYYDRRTSSFGTAGGQSRSR
jgi:TIR domain